MDDITGYVLWGVGILFFIAVIVGIGAVVAGRLFSMPHASKVGMISIVVVALAAVGYVVAPPIIDAILGDGCI